MSTTVKTGWLKDKDGNKFAPKTLTSQVQTSDGVLLEDKIQADLDAAKEDILANVSIEVDTELSSTSTNPVQNKAINEEFEVVSQSFAILESAIDDKADASHTHEIEDITDLQTTIDTINEEISDKALMITTYNGSTLDKTFDEMLTHINNGGNVVVKYGCQIYQLVLNDVGEELRFRNIEVSNYRSWSEIVTSNISISYDDKVTEETTLNRIYTTTQTDEKLAEKADLSHTHDGDYDALGAADTALASAKEYTDSKTASFASTSSVTSAISTHNTSTSAHSDIRELISDLTTKLNNFLDVDDTTTDQLSEVLTLIENNKGTLESLTTSKVNVSDIIDNLTTSSTSKVLSANQGVAIKSLIDALQAELDSHTHEIADVSGLQSVLDGKAASSHGTHVTYSTTAPKMDGTASAGSASTVARTDHVHPTDTSRASQADLEALTETVAGKANSSHTHTIANITNLQTTLDSKAASSHNHKVSEISDLTATATELNYMDGVTSSVQTQLDAKAASSHAHSAATTSAAGFMSASDKSKLDGITANADSVSFSQSLTSGAAVGTITINGTGTTMYAPTNTDTKNTAGSTDSSKKLFLIGAESQAANPQTYSHDTAYVGTDGCLYSGGSKVLTAHPTISVGDDTTSTASPAHSGTFTAVDSVTRDGNGHVTKINTKTVTLPAQYTHPSYTARTGVPTANATPAFGGTVTISQITSDATGHVTGATDRTITIPSTTATQSASGLMSAEDKIQMDYGGIPIVTTSGTGAAYTATVDGMTALTNGMKVTIIPHTVSTTTAPTLNVNSLGAKTIRMPIAYNTSTTSAGAVAAWLAASKPVTLEYNGTYWITIGLTRPTATSLSGTVAIANGGTGATTAATALTNLGLTATAAELNTLDGITATVTELNYCDGVTSNIQTQLNAKASTEHNHKGQNINPSCLELGSGASGHGGYIDFHYNDSTDDYTSRIIESASGTINVDAKLTTTGTINGYTLAAACAKAVTDSSSASAISTGISLVTERDVYYGLPTINGSHTYTSSTNIYAPTAVGTSGYVLVSSGSGAPTWKDIGAITATTGSFTVSTGSASLTVKKRAGVVTVSGYITPKATGVITVGTIASGFRPATKVYGVGQTSPDTTDGRTGASYSIDTSGVLKAANGDASNTTYFSVTYVAA